MGEKRLDEGELDGVLARALQHSPEFADWFLQQTKFNGQRARCVFVRADNPWSTVLLQQPNPTTGGLEARRFECETDVLAVFETAEGRRLGIHIENKIRTGSFTELQPELYAARVEQWKNRPRLGRYSEGTTVLIAPLEFMHRYPTGAALFHTRISHESIAERLPNFGCHLES